MTSRVASEAMGWIRCSQRQSIRVGGGGGAGTKAGH